MSATTIYDEQYAAAYPALYGRPWEHKHTFNARVLAALFEDLRRRRRRTRACWLDVACGQGWQLSLAPRWLRCVGLDLSGAQLRRAQRNAPRAALVRADMRRDVLRPRSFGLLTSFWAAYAYLDDAELIDRWVRRCVRWLAPGGSLYLELLLPADLAGFNDSIFAAGSGFRVEPRSPDWSRWRFEDCGGSHDMTSPPLEAFLERLRPSFEALEATHDGSFMTHVVARRKCAR